MSLLYARMKEIHLKLKALEWNEEDPIKNEGARVVTTLFINFSNAQGQLTPKSVMKSCRNSNSSELL